MSARTGGRIGGYRLLRDFVGGANCRWTFAEAAGQEFFLKEFQRPKYPPDHLPAALRTARLARCAAFEQRHRRLLAALRQAGAGIVAPVAFFREGLAYYHVAPRVRIADLAAATVARQPRGERLAFLRSLARSVAALHAQRIVHGDLKPGNVLSGPTGAQVIDFDGAFLAGEPPDPDDLEFDQGYMAPETLAYVQAGPSAPGLAADVFSLGVLLHEYWTGFRPVPAGPHQYAAEAVRAGDGVRLLGGALEPALDRLIRRALAADPAARPTAWEIDAALASPAAPAGSVPVFPQMAPARHATRPAGFAEPPTPPLRPSAPEIVIRRSKNLARDDEG